VVTKKLLIVILLPLTTLWSVAGCAGGPDKPVLKDVFAGHFLIGGAFNRNLVSGKDPNAAAIVIKHFNTATSENITGNQPIVLWISPKRTICFLSDTA